MDRCREGVATTRGHKWGAYDVHLCCEGAAKGYCVPRGGECICGS